MITNTPNLKAKQNAEALDIPLRTVARNLKIKVKYISKEHQNRRLSYEISH